MKIKINRFGLLSIYKRGEYRGQYCPFDSYQEREDSQKCGDWCPLFSIFEQVGQDDTGRNTYFNVLRLCHAMYQLESIEYAK